MKTIKGNRFVMYYASPYSKKPRPRKKQLFLAAAVFLIFFIGAYAYGQSKNEDKKPQTDNQLSGQEQKSSKPEDSPFVRLTATGDMLPHLTVNNNAKTGDTYDYQKFFTEVKPFLATGNINFCNQESPSAAGIGIAGYPEFNAPTKFSQDLNAIGCNLINLANNHSLDKGQAGINGTIDTWASLKTLAVAGTYKSPQDQNKIAYFESKGIKFALLSYTICSNVSPPNTYSVNTLSKELTDRQLPEARRSSDILIVSTHWCREDVSDEDTSQKEWTQYLSEKGADIVLGTGPHYLQPVKRLPKAGGGETIVFFSLGNFLSTQEDINGLVGGIAVIDIDIKSKKPALTGFLPTYMHYEWTAAQKAAGDLTARRNLMLYPLDQAADPLKKSLHNTSVEEQTKRVSDLLNKYTAVPILSSKTFPKN